MGVNFLAPAAFWLAAVLPVVVLFYLLKRKRVVRLISSTVLWQRFLAESQASSPFQRLRHNWLLVLQLLVLLLAILALARPFFAAQAIGGRLQVVILDASASMQSTDVSPSRFERARTEALRLVDSLRPTDQMIVLQVAAVAEVKQSATSDKAVLRRALQACAVTDAGTRLTEALRMAESLTRDNSQAEVHLFSDGAAAGLEEMQNKGLRLVYHRFGERASNAGIASLDLRPNPEDPTQRAIFTSIVNAAPEPRRTEVELRFEGRLVETKPVTIAPTNSVPVVFVAQQSRDGVFEVRLTGGDDLPADDRAQIISQLPRPIRVLLVSRGNRFLERALRFAGLVELSVAPQLTDPSPPFDMVVLDGVMPAVWPSLNVLAIQTMNTNWFDRAGMIENPPIVDWRAAHPLMRFVSLDNVQVARSTAVSTPTWGVRVIEAPQTPLVVAGELGRQRVVWIGFDLLESTWPLRISFPIFMANAVDWLNPAAIRASQRLVRAGEPFRLPLDGPVGRAELIRPDGTRQPLALDPEATELVVGDTSRQGLYRVVWSTNDLAFAVNLLDSAETDTRPRAELDFGRFGEVTATTTRRASLEIWRWIALAALAVLLFEWWFYHRRTA
jgi:Ca-activated chloride channel homolog